MREKLYQILRDYDLKDIFNYDETGLFWKMKPSYIISNGPVAGTKQSKNCVTILFTCNSTRTEKLRLLFIHKYENPRALKILTKILFWSIIIETRRVECKYQSGMIILKN